MNIMEKEVEEEEEEEEEDERQEITIYQHIRLMTVHSLNSYFAHVASNDRILYIVRFVGLFIVILNK